MSVTGPLYTAPSGWRNVARVGSNKQDMYPQAGRVLTWVEERLSPARTWSVKVGVWAVGIPESATTATVVIQGRAHTVPTKRWTYVSQVVDALRPLVIEVPAVTYANASVEVTATDVTLPAAPRPCDTLALDAWLPIPTDALRWDQGRWDRSAWQTTSAVPGTLVWDQGRWDSGRWEDRTLTSCWTPILGACTRVTTRRGMTATGPVLQAEGGTLTIEATEDLDPRALGMIVGTKVRLYDWTNLTFLWSGQVADVAVTPIKGGGATVQITAVDDVARIAAITRHGARPDGGGTETWSQRLARLATSAPGITINRRAADATSVCPTVWETSLASHLDALVATTGGAWAGSRYGGVDVWPTLPDPGTPMLTLTDSHDDDATPGVVWHYTAGPAAWSTSSLVAAIEATNHTAAQEGGEWRARDERLTVTDPTAATTWTGTTVKVDTIAATTDAARQAAERLLRRATTAPLLTQASIWHVSQRTSGSQQLGAMRRATWLDPLTPVLTVQRGERATCLIASVTHDITPLTWRTDLTLTPTNRRGDLQ